MTTSSRPESFRLPPLASQKLLELSRPNSLIKKQTKHPSVFHIQKFLVLYLFLSYPFSMDESAIVSNQKILEIIEKPLAERDVNLYIEKAARALAQILQCDGLLVLRVDEGPNLVEKISIAYSLPGTPTSIVFEPEAFPTTPKDGEVIRIDSRSVKNIGDTNSATNYDFFATQFGNSQKTQLLIVGLKKSESTKLEGNDLQTWAICSKILGTYYEMIYVLNTYAEQISVNTDKDQLTRVHNYKSFTHQLKIAIEESNGPQVKT